MKQERIPFFAIATGGDVWCRRQRWWCRGVTICRCGSWPGGSAAPRSSANQRRLRSSHHLEFSCARQTSSFQPSRPWSGSRLSPLTSPCPGLAQNNAALPCIIRVLTDACISARYTYPSRSLQNSSSSSRLFQLWLSLVSFRSFHQFHCYFQIGSPCVLSSSHFSCDMSPSPNSAMTTSYANRHRHDWRMSLTPNSNAGRC